MGGLLLFPGLLREDSEAVSNLGQYESQIYLHKLFVRRIGHNIGLEFFYFTTV